LVATVEGCEHAVVTLVSDGHFESPAANDAGGTPGGFRRQPV
jgi:hypothetical protein